MYPGTLFVVSGPSGTGKGTLVARILRELPEAWLSVSATTRAPRPEDIPGVSYLFMQEDEFMALADEDGFLEWARYSKNCYGSPKAPVLEHLQAGNLVVLEIEVQGALQIKKKLPEAHLVFIAPPSLEELERRLRSRGTESDEVIERRLSIAKDELAQRGSYEACIVNDDLDTAVSELVAYMRSCAEGNRLTAGC